MEFAVGQIEKLGVPWLFTWGNHDRLTDYAHGQTFLAEAKHSLYRGGHSEGNYLELHFPAPASKRAS